jgi:hypothetical protein
MIDVEMEFYEYKDRSNLNHISLSFLRCGRGFPSLKQYVVSFIMFISKCTYIYIYMSICLLKQTIF